MSLAEKLAFFVASSVCLSGTLAAQVGATYSACRQAIPAQYLADPGLSVLLEDLQGTAEFKSTRFSVNGPYDPQAVNILTPRKDSPWPAACEIPPQPAACASSP